MAESAESLPRLRWREFFDAHAPHYDQNEFTKWTATEVSFLIEKLELTPDMHLIDIGCGTGRHAVEFARRGFRVTGVDQSAGMLEQARLKAERAGVEVELVHADAREFVRESAFDAAICLCEGGLGLADFDVDPLVHDLAILRNAFADLRSGAPFAITALNGYSIIRRMTDEHVKGGAFDPATMMAQYLDEWNLPEGKQKIVIRERLFIPPEFVAMLRHVGFEVRNVWGGTAGEWGVRPVKLDEIEAMYICRKP